MLRSTLILRIACPAVIFTLMLGLLAGCAGTVRSPADQLLDLGDYDAAIAAYQTEEQNRPSDPRVKRNLGIAYLETGAFASALAKLIEARELSPDDPETQYFLARAAEDAENFDLAIDGYTRYLSLTRKNEPGVRARIQDLSIQKATAEILASIQQEKNLDPSAIPENTIAVYHFLNSAERTDLDPLSHGLAAMLITDLSQVEELRVLERERIGILLDEISLATPRRDQPVAHRWLALETIEGIKERLRVLLRPGTGEAYFQAKIDARRTQSFLDAVRSFQEDHGLTIDGMPGPNTQKKIEEALSESGIAPSAMPQITPTPIVEPDTAPRLGRLLGARRLVQGSFAPTGTREIQLDAALVEVVDGSSAAVGPPVAGPLDTVLRLEKKLVYQILEFLGIEPTGRERDRIDRLPTESFLAFLAYSRGLALEEQGRPADALNAYQEALNIDPGFDSAIERTEILTVTPEEIKVIDRSEFQKSLESPVDLSDRMIRTGSWVGIGPGPIIDRDGTLDPSVQPSGKIDGDAEIIIEGDLPGRQP